MRIYIGENKKMNFEMSKMDREAVKAAIKAFEAGIKYASNVSDDEKQSKLSRYIAESFLDEESKKVAQYSYFNFIYQLKEKLGLQH